MSRGFSCIALLVEGHKADQVMNASTLRRLSTNHRIVEAASLPNVARSVTEVAVHNMSQLNKSTRRANVITADTLSILVILSGTATSVFAVNSTGCVLEFWLPGNKATLLRA